MKSKLILTIILGLFITGCSERREKIIDMSDVIGESERYKEVQIPIIKDVSELDSTLVVKDWFINQGVNITSLKFRSDRMFLDRFGAITSEKYNLITPIDTILYSKWIYQDSLKVMNAFTNWIDCFGDNCNTIFFGEQKNFQRNPLQVLMNDSTLIFIEGENIVDFNLWNEFHNVGNNHYWNFVIEQSRWGKARWYTFLEGNRTKLEL